MFLGKLDKHIWKPKKKGSGLKLPGGNLLKILKILEESGKIKILIRSCLSFQMLQDLNENLAGS